MKFNPGREGLGLQALLKSCLLQNKLTPYFHTNRPSLYQQPTLGVTLGLCSQVKLWTWSVVLWAERVTSPVTGPFLSF